MREWRYIYDSY
jgi:hypothetical protein